jgi:hypothetical protein
MNQSIQLTLSSDKKTSIKFNVNDEPFTSLCDYSDTCNYECINTIGTEDKEDISSYSYQFTKNNKIKDKIKSLFKIKHVYTKKQSGGKRIKKTKRKLKRKQFKNTRKRVNNTRKQFKNTRKQFKNTRKQFKK